MSATRSCTTATWSRACRSRRGLHRGTSRNPAGASRRSRWSFPPMACRNRCRPMPQARNLFYLDATCPLVSKVHKQAMRHQRLGRHVVLIGHAGHPEVIGTMGQLPEGAVTLVETEADVARFEPADPAASASSPRRRCRSTTPPASSARCRSAFPHMHGAGRRIDLLRHHQPPGSGQGGGARRRSLPRRRRAEFVQFQAPRRGRRARRREESLLVQRASEIPWDEHRRDLDARPVGRRVGAGDHRRRDHRGLPRALRRDGRTRR